jgi:hypothetical protein
MPAKAANITRATIIDEQENSLLLVVSSKKKPPLQKQPERTSTQLRHFQAHAKVNMTSSSRRRCSCCSRHNEIVGNFARPRRGCILLAFTGMR